MIRLHHSLVIVIVGASLARGSVALADGPSKEVCVDSHGRGQDARDLGKLSLARKLFLACAQTSCPTLVQGDCARFADDLTRLQPSLSFSARDQSGGDLPDTSVYIDDLLVVTRLDDGKPHDVDPGKHVIKFTHGSKEQVVTLVVGTGEKSRIVAATFVSAVEERASVQPQRRKLVTTTTHPTGSKLLIGVGGALVAGGTLIGIIGISRVPANCRISTHQCAAPPGDQAFTDAGKAIKMSNLGFLTAGVGLAAVLGGAVWYVSRGKTSREDTMVAPWVTPSSAGFALTGPL